MGPISTVTVLSGLLVVGVLTTLFIARYRDREVRQHWTEGWLLAYVALTQLGTCIAGVRWLSMVVVVLNVGFTGVLLVTLAVTSRRRADRRMGVA